MLNEANQKDTTPENDDLKDLKGIFKAMIVNVAWDYADILEKNKRAASQQKTGEKSQEEKTDPKSNINE